jgi:hypothetical protein
LVALWIVVWTWRWWTSHPPRYPGRPLVHQVAANIPHQYGQEVDQKAVLKFPGSTEASKAPACCLPRKRKRHAMFEEEVFVLTNMDPVRLAYQPPANSTFLLEGQTLSRCTLTSTMLSCWPLASPRRHS